MERRVHRRPAARPGPPTGAGVASLGYRNAVLSDARGRPLAYVDRLALRLSGSRKGTIGLGGASFAPGVLERLGHGLARVIVSSRAVRRGEILGLTLSFHAGESPTPEGGWHCEAAVGAFRAFTSARTRTGSRRD